MCIEIVIQSTISFLSKFILPPISNPILPYPPIPSSPVASSAQVHPHSDIPVNTRIICESAANRTNLQRVSSFNGSLVIL